MKLELANIFNKNILEKKPIKGGTPASENMKMDNERRKKLSKL